MTAGLFYAAPFEGRPDDHFGVAIGRTHYNPRAGQAFASMESGAPAPRAEYDTEIYYSYLATPWLALRPDLQYIIHPGGYFAESNAVVLGARTVVTF